MSLLPTNITDTTKAAINHAKYHNDVNTAVNALSIPSGNTMGVVVHGTTAIIARPVGYSVVTWIGSVQPANALINDLWNDTTV